MATLMDFLGQHVVERVLRERRHRGAERERGEQRATGCGGRRASSSFGREEGRRIGAVRHASSVPLRIIRVDAVGGGAGLGYTSGLVRTLSCGAVVQSSSVQFRSPRGPAASRHLAAAPAPFAHRARDLALAQPEVPPRASRTRRPRSSSAARSPTASFAPRPSDWPAGCMRGRQARRPGRDLHAELPAIRDRPLRDPARQCRRGAGQPDEPRRGTQALHHRPGHQGRDQHRRPGGRTRQGQQCAGAQGPRWRT